MNKMTIMNKMTEVPLICNFDPNGSLPSLVLWSLPSKA